MSTNKEPSYTSEFAHSLDDRNRVTIPSAWRATHNADDVLLAVPQSGKNGKYIAVLPKAEADKLRAKIAAFALSDASAQDFAATYFARTQQLWFDKAGRIGLNAALLKHAGVAMCEEGMSKGGDVVLVGSLTKFHIYTPEVWAETQASAAKENEETMRRLGI